MDQYSVVRRLGSGAFGVAYLAKSKEGRSCVIKQISLDMMNGVSFEKEVKVLSKMSHPNIVAYWNSFVDHSKRKLCIVMDFCDGGDLYSRITENKKQDRLFTEDQVLDWFTQICLAVNYIHKKSILHRDIKSQNIFLKSTGIIKVGDFGISRSLSGKEMAHTMIGTPYFLSPEICENKPYSYKSDVWALGCVLYELLTLKNPFFGSSTSNLVLKIIKGQYQPISSYYSQGLNRLVTAMFRYEPRDRPNTDRILALDFMKKRVQKFQTAEDARNGKAAVKPESTPINIPVAAEMYELERPGKSKYKAKRNIANAKKGMYDIFNIKLDNLEKERVSRAEELSHRADCHHRGFCRFNADVMKCDAVQREFAERKKAAARNKANAEAEIYGRPFNKPEPLQKHAGQKRCHEQCCKNKDEKDYLENLKQIRIQNYNDRIRLQAQLGKIQARDNAKQQIKQGAKVVPKQFKQGLQECPKLAAEKRCLQPNIPLTEALEAIGAVNNEADDVKKQAPPPVEDKREVKKQKGEILKRINEKPMLDTIKDSSEPKECKELVLARSRWSNQEVPDFNQLQLQNTTSVVEGTLSAELNKPAARQKWGKPRETLKQVLLGKPLQKSTGSLTHVSQSELDSDVETKVAEAAKLKAGEVTESRVPEGCPVIKTSLVKEGTFVIDSAVKAQPDKGEDAKKAEIKDETKDKETAVIPYDKAKKGIVRGTFIVESAVRNLPTEKKSVLPVEKAALMLDLVFNDVKGEKAMDKEKSFKYDLKTGRFDIADKMILRTCSEPDLSKLFVPAVQSLSQQWLPLSSRVKSMDLQGLEQNMGSGSIEAALDVFAKDVDTVKMKEMCRKSEEIEEEEDDRINVIKSMRNLLLSSTSEESDNGLVSEERECEQDSDVDVGAFGFTDDDDDESKPDLFCNLEESRRQLEIDVGCRLLGAVYWAIQAIHENEEESIEDGAKKVIEMLGDKADLYPRIFQLVMADIAYMQNN